jgi:hypothetical protein
MAKPDRSAQLQDLKIPSADEVEEELSQRLSQFWRFDKSLHDSLTRKSRGGPHLLDFDEAFVLHRQMALKDLRSKGAQSDLMQPQGEARWAPEKRERTAVLRRLQERESPFGPRPGAVWAGPTGNVGGKEGDADFEGWILNTALTHLGSIEAIALGAQEVGDDALIPLDAIMQISFVDPPQWRPFRRAAIFWEGQEDRFDVFALPMLYGTSALSPLKSDQEATGSRYVRPYPVEAIKAGMGVGLGRQELTLRTFAGEVGSGDLFSVQEIYFPLYPEDPRFDAQCARRGVDPEKLRAELEGKD